MKDKLKKALTNADGTINGKVVAGLISLLIVLVQQVLGVFGLRFHGDVGSLIGAINTVLTILGLIGVLENPGIVTKPNE